MLQLQDLKERARRRTVCVVAAGLVAAGFVAAGVEEAGVVQAGAGGCLLAFFLGPAAMSLEFSSEWTGCATQHAWRAYHLGSQERCRGSIRNVPGTHSG